MERATNNRGPSHQERGHGTANGFFAIVLGAGAAGRRRDDALAIALPRLSGLGHLRAGDRGHDPGRADARGLVHAAAQRGGDPAALRRLPGHEPRAGPARHQSVLFAQEDFAARAQPERRQAQGQRQARQSDRDRRGRRLARRGLGQGRVRRRRLRDVRKGAKRIGRCATWPRRSPTTPRKSWTSPASLRCSKARTSSRARW